MNKLMYAEMIKHINHSVIKPSERYTYCKDDVTLCAKNPASQLHVYFSRDSMTQPYHVHLHDIAIFTPDESEKLFKYVEYRYNAKFKDKEYDQIRAYETLLVSNAATQNRNR